VPDQMLRVAIILGSTRPGRNGEVVSRWIYEIAKKRNDADFELVDIKDFNLPLLDEPIPPSMGRYSKEHTKIWSAKINSFDAYVFVTAEYNHGIPGALKNAIDFLFKEWNNKVAGFVSYGGSGGIRAVEQLRLVMAELYVATVRSKSSYRFLQTSRTPRSSNLPLFKRNRPILCWMKSLLGAAL
jgi:NAD(P)H-dependent FMN reductase